MTRSKAELLYTLYALCALAILSTGNVSCDDDIDPYFKNRVQYHGVRLPRVVGGYNATEDQFKYIASLQIFSFLHYCGGAIISPRTIVTAAHCRKVFAINAMVGSIFHKDLTARRYRVNKWIIHDLYDPETLNYDLALAILDEDIQFDEHVQPISLASGPSQPGDKMILSGWGFTSFPSPPEGPPNHMQWMTTNIIDKRTCDDFHPDVETHICMFKSEGHGICSGDSGGPLVNEDGELVGVISSGYACAIGYPDSCTDVFMFRDWIIDNMV